MTRHIPMNERTRPYWIYKFRRVDPGWAVWDRRRARLLAAPDGTWLHPTHADAVAALDAHLRERNGHGSTGVK